MYQVPEKPARAELIVKKSRFLASALYASDRGQAMESLRQIKDEFPDAGHHCWAYLLGTPTKPNSLAMSDDGEPSGTAGKPILNVLQHKDVGNVMVVVTRYFGGIKLGAGGLVRAYSSAAQQVMEALVTQVYVRQERRRVTVPFNQEQALRHWLSINDGTLIDATYVEDVLCIVELPESACQALAMRAGESGWLIGDVKSNG